MSRDTFTIYQEILPQVTLPRDTLRCEAVPVQLDAGRDGLKYQWSTAAKDTLRNLTIDLDGVYTLTSSGVFCTQTDTVKIWQASKVRFKDQFYCNEFAHTEDLDAADEASYLWYDGTATRTKTFTSRGNYWGEISQRNGQCVSRDSFSIRNSVVRLELGDDQHFCDTVYAELDGGPDGIAYKWSTAESTRGISVTEPGVYSVLVEDSLGCTRLDSVTIRMTISPTLSLPRDTTICVNDPILISGPDGFTYLWSTGATTQQESLGVEGAYSLQITDEYGCFATDKLS